MDMRDLTPFIGTEITGATIEDLRQDEVFDSVLERLAERELVVVRGLQITPSEQIELARRIGRPVPFLMSRYRHPDHEEIMISSNEMRENKPVGVARVGNFWHQDSSYVADPAPYTLLHGVNAPSTSGHTLYANAVDVYNRLPDEWKARIAGRTALHSVAKRYRIRAEHAGLSVAELRAVIAQEHPPVEHPLVCKDPDSGHEYLYGAPEYLHSVVGFDANENEEFFSLIDSLIQDPDHVYVHRWTPNDLVLWKTATTYHAATAVEPGVSRTVHRVSIVSADQWAA
ncbi:TauD/TfdA dioxygenase family protein [Streptomyces sp. NBC_00859]|uniref:TauD/TfdA dioxygenase family protein n=1 Tax=Streptomyces sp. NBC_00859 TaxID=2903682 RepID=UPI00386BF0B1|nr:TauD/TfdA family dioxygenase [Streptomyces sp. NBC_00859]WSZ86733.1 TauD/TfdA family dioxygenase [Streptomyces sp. NBC_00859]